MPIVNLTRNTWMATKVRKAETFLTRLIGLLLRRSLGPEEALWMVPSKGIHTLGMRFPIDVVFLDQKNRVIALRSGMPPCRTTAVYLKARSALELPNGTIKKSHTEIGDLLEISLPEPSAMDDLKETRLSQIG